MSSSSSSSSSSVTIWLRDGLHKLFGYSASALEDYLLSQAPISTVDELISLIESSGSSANSNEIRSFCEQLLARVPRPSSSSSSSSSKSNSYIEAEKLALLEKRKNDSYSLIE